MSTQEMFQKTLAELIKVNNRFDRIEQNQVDEIRPLHKKVRRIERVFNQKALEKPDDAAIAFPFSQGGLFG